MRGDVCGFELLAAAIVDGAVRDYRACRLWLQEFERSGRLLRQTQLAKYKKERQKRETEMMKIEHFIKSDYFRLLTAIEPDLLLKQLWEEKL